MAARVPVLAIGALHASYIYSTTSVLAASIGILWRMGFAGRAFFREEKQKHPLGFIKEPRG